MRRLLRRIVTLIVSSHARCDWRFGFLIQRQGMKPKTSELMKFKQLCRRLGESKRGVVGLLELLWNETAKNCPEGDVGRYTDEEIAIMCDWDADPEKLIDALVETKWLDRCST